MTKKILHIQKVKGISGSEKHLADLLIGLSQEFEIHFLILEEASLPQDDYISLFAGSAVKIHRMPISQNFSRQLIGELKRFFKKEKFDLIHTHLIHADIHGAFAAKLARIPVVSTKHGWDIYEKMTFSQRSLLRLASSIPARFICISHALVPFLKKFEHVSLKKITVIHYGLDPLPQNQMQESESSEFFMQGPLKIIYLGRLVIEKGLVELLHAVGALQNEGIDVELNVVGTGPYFSQLQEVVKSYEIQKVNFLGFQKDIHQLIKQHHALILPSYGEGFGLVCLEAMGVKRAVLASNITALPEIVVDGITGFLFEPRSSQAIVSVLQKVSQSRSRLQNMGLAGYERLISVFSKEKMIKATAEFYHRF